MLSTAIDTLIFDLDNTLVDRNLAMRKAMQHWLQIHPHSNCSLENIMEQDAGGYADRNVFCNWLLDTFGTEVTGIDNAAALLPFIQQSMIKQLSPDERILQLLAKLKRNFRLVLASNGGSATQRAKLQQCGLLTFFEPEHIFISGEVGLSKPDPAFFSTILNKLAIHPAQAMMTGDNILKDILPAQQCGLTSCWVSHGGTPYVPATPDLIIHHTTELEQWLKC
jgi:putative hydrolase of the HAD superfamily